MKRLKIAPKSEEMRLKEVIESDRNRTKTRIKYIPNIPAIFLVIFAVFFSIIYLNNRFNKIINARSAS